MPRDAAHHAQVRRLAAGDAIALFDGEGREWHGVVVRVGRREVVVGQLRAVEPLPEPAAPLVLVTALLPAERLDWVVQKGTELGMTHWVPLVTAFSQVAFDSERGEKKRHHWRQVAASAAAQCGRARVPEILPVTDLHHLHERLTEWRLAPLTWFWLQPGGQVLPEISPPHGGALFAVGPEGGWREDETRYFATQQGVQLTLAPWVLRAETAAVAVLAQAIGWWQAKGAVCAE